MFQELWMEECKICLDNQEIYFINECNCKELVCKLCYEKLQKCPYCRYQYSYCRNQYSYNRFSRFDRRTANIAKRNWNFWFGIYGGREIMRSYIIPLYFNHDIIHLLLNTDQFDDPRTGGMCVNRDIAQHFVWEQLQTFLQERTGSSTLRSF